MKLNKLRSYLSRAEQHVARGNELIARQRALILDLTEDGYATEIAESILQSLLETQRLQEESLARLMDELKAEAPEEWKARYAPVDPRHRLNEGNGLLNSLPIEDLTLLQPFLEGMKLRVRQRLQLANRKMKAVHFPESGMISVMAISGGGRQTQIGFIGREGMTGLPVAFGSDKSPFDLQVEIEGYCQSILMDDLLSVLAQSQPLRERVISALKSIWVEFAHTAAANAVGTVEQRLARLLLLVRERVQSDEISLTHEQLALMMSVRRAGVTVALQHFQAEQLIGRERGSMTILDREGLKAKASVLQ
jgi:CRP-like cAMP-binding protein